MAGSDDDFVTKTTKHRKKAGSDQTPKKPADDAPAGAAGGNGSAEGISLRPRTMFAMKGRGRTESEQAAYRPQWSKDGEGFVSAGVAGKDGDRRKSKVLRYSREELLALHVPSTTAPEFPPDTPVASEHCLPPVGTLPFDYDEIYKQWSLNRNRGRGRGRGAATTGNQNTRGAHERSRSEGKWGDEPEHGKKDDGNHEGGDRWERGAKQSENSRGTDMWDDVGSLGADGGEFDLTSMAEAAEKFRREMDLMREQLKEPSAAPTTADDLDAFDKKLEDAAAAGQFEDSDEEVQWDDPVIDDNEAPLGESMTTSLLDTTETSSHHHQAGNSIFEALEPTPPTPATSAFELEDKTTFSLGALQSEARMPVLGGLQFEVKDEWFYLDPQGLQQGPFKTAEMREWFEAGYFKPHLPIRFGREGGFTPLANQFLHGQLPFSGIPQISRQSEHERMLEFQREQQRQQQLQQQQQQQQQLLQMQRQQQEQQRLMQLNHEEKIRLEMQRLEIARQQQSHIFQQQQMLHLQQQQQQQQQQHMLLQQQTSWQRSQREGIMSALGLFGNGQSSGVTASEHDAFRPNPLQQQQQHQQQQQQHLQQQQQPQQHQLSYGMDFGNQQELRSGVPSPHQNIGFMAANPAWPVAATTASIGLQQINPTPPEPVAEKATNPLDVGAWGRSSIGSNSKVDAETDEMRQAADAAAREELNSSRSSRTSEPQQPEAAVQQPSPQKKAKEIKPSSTKPQQTQKTESVWGKANSSVSQGASKAPSPPKKSLKEIQEEEQRELRNRMQESSSQNANLAQMGAQLKMMLGVHGQSTTPAPASAPASTASPVPPPAPTSAPAKAPAPAPPAPPVNAWGAAAATNSSNSGKSMRDILAEEERLAIERAKKAESAPASSHWVNVVAGNSVAASVPKPVARSLGPVPASVLKSRQQARAGPANGSDGSVKRPGATPTRVETDASFWNFGAASNSSSSNEHAASSSNAFGSNNVSPEFMGWATKQLQAIDPNANVTLLEYCASVEDPGEIREYLAAYLGSTPRVSAFATEFIQRKKKNSGAKKSPSNAGIKPTSPADVLDASGKKNRRRSKKTE